MSKSVPNPRIPDQRRRPASPSCALTRPVDDVGEAADHMLAAIAAASPGHPTTGDTRLAVLDVVRTIVDGMAASRNARLVAE